MLGRVAMDLPYSTNHLLQLSPWCVNKPQLKTLLAGCTIGTGVAGGNSGDEHPNSG